MKSILICVIIAVLAWALPASATPPGALSPVLEAIPILRSPGGMRGPRWRPPLRLPERPKQPDPGRFDLGALGLGEQTGEAKSNPSTRIKILESVSKPPQSKGIKYGQSEFFTLEPSRHEKPLHAKEVFKQSIEPYLKSIGFPLNRIYVPDHFGVPMATTNVKGLLGLRCGEQMVWSHRPGVRDLCGSLNDAFAGDANTAFSKAVKFHTGKTVQDYSRTLSAVELEYFYQQFHSLTESERSIPNVPAVVPIEHSGIRATAWEGETVNSGTRRVFSRYKTRNRVAISQKEVNGIARLALKKRNIVCCSKPIVPDQANLVLLPGDKFFDVPTEKYVAEMRFAYRIPVKAEFQLDGQRRSGLFYLWLDAEDKTGKILQLVSLTSAATATGDMIVRDPSTGQTLPVEFSIDDSAGTPPAYILRLLPQFQQLARYSSTGTSNFEVSALKTAFPNPAFPDFRVWLGQQQSPAKDLPVYQCVYDQTAPYPGIYYEQINLMATLTRRWREVEDSGGLLPGFPGGYPIKVKFDMGNQGCSPTSLSSYQSAGPLSGAEITFGLCKRAPSSSCPAPSIPGTNPIHDHTIVSHELGHVLTGFQYRYVGFPTSKRSPLWCDPSNTRHPLGAPQTCPIPDSPSPLFHDFADAWAHHFEDTNCVGGWVAKDELNSGSMVNDLDPITGGLNQSRRCTRHSEGGGLPRLSQAGFPDLDDPDSRDQFPYHRKWVSDYANMQIAAAALWATREGIRSHLGPLLGPEEYFTGFVRALRSTGWLGSGYAESYDDLHVFLGLLDLEFILANEWVKNPESSTRFLLSKITAGFAKAGIFIIPPTCIDGDTLITDPHYCSAGEDGGDAVIDIDDNDPSDDETVHGVSHKEVDYLKRSGSAPTFLIWTGPTYTFNNGAATTAGPPPCNKEYKVEVATDSEFTGASLVIKDWESLPANGVPCFVRWTPDSTQWNALKGNSGELTKVYYRVKTRKNSGALELSSTSPAKGLFDAYFPGMSVPPPYAVINDTGAPVYTVPLPVTDPEPPHPPQGLHVQ